MKSFIFLLFFIFLCNFVSSIELSISPSQIDFNAKTNQESCKEITISTIKNSILIGSDRWAEKNIVQRNFFLHNLSSKDLDIKINYPTNLKVDEITNAKICIVSKNSGIYHGLLLYKTQNSSAGVGIWMNLNITESEKFSIIKLTGNAISIENNKTSLFILPIFLIIILIFLFVKLNRKTISIKKKKYKNSS